MVMPGIWREYDDIYHCQGDHTLADTIVEQEDCSPLSEMEANRKEKQKITFDTWKKQNDNN